MFLSVVIFNMQQNPIKPLRLSSSLIIHLADNGLDRNRYLMLTRKPHMSFQNSLVFPGGVCEPQDQKFTNVFAQFSKITAIRETLEQTGILVVPPNSVINSINQLKDKYQKKQLNKLNKLIYQYWQNHLNLIVPIARFITPHIPGISRFDCYFFGLKEGVIRLNLGKSSSLLQLSIATEESSKYYWLTPLQYLKLQQNGQGNLPPPQRILLNYLKQQPQPFKQLAVEPFLGQLKREAFVLPGDKDYDYQRFNKTQPNSRTKQQINNFIKSSQKFKQNKIRRIVGVFPPQAQRRKSQPSIFRLQLSDIQNQKTFLSLGYIKPKL